MRKRLQPNVIDAEVLAMEHLRAPAWYHYGG